jgi:methyltransferase family protein
MTKSRYDQFEAIVERVRPSSIAEIGMHRGRRAVFLVGLALRHKPSVSYLGCDIFEAADPEFHRQAMNGKGPAKHSHAVRAMTNIERHYGRHRFGWQIVAGDTRETLHPGSIVVDLAFIDGDHRLETIRSDYAAVAGSRCVVFDDYLSPDAFGLCPDRDSYGANGVVDELNAEILPHADPCFGGGLSQMAVIYR